MFAGGAYIDFFGIHFSTAVVDIYNVNTSSWSVGALSEARENLVV
jgi:hypothetical protein